MGYSRTNLRITFVQMFWLLSHHFFFHKIHFICLAEKITAARYGKDTIDDDNDVAFYDDVIQNEKIF